MVTLSLFARGAVGSIFGVSYGGQGGISSPATPLLSTTVSGAEQLKWPSDAASNQQWKRL